MKSTIGAVATVVLILLCFLGTGLYFLFSKGGNTVQNSYIEYNDGFDQTTHRVDYARYVVFDKNKNGKPVLDFTGHAAIWDRAGDVYIVFKENSESKFKVFPNAMFLKVDANSKEEISLQYGK